MENIVVWQGISDKTLEVLKWHYVKNNIEVQSVINGNAEGISVLINYKAVINAAWEISYVEIRSVLGEKETFNTLKKEDGKWFKNNELSPEFSDCTDIDITLTPFTNSLPVNRLSLKMNEEKLINVVYVNIMEKEIAPAQQRYKKLSDTTYRFQTVPNDFEAIITFDDTGFVTDYPGLFQRAEIH